ncbi:hypothetical protein QBC38DRAFT_486866 [Podospora fimiseda]|uniref:Carrier domain-containing protein n=1 Tax=Podospora fimiseda TaxID=252190 RepID=A0AAN7GYK3_9PEZI|nr:hypothetical protein QBC38DRAFT_486866 [Podospora fimiseda]
MKAQTIRGMMLQLAERKKRDEVADDSLALQLSNDQKLKSHVLEVLKTKLGVKFQRVNPDGLAIRPTTALQDSMVADMFSSDFRLYFNHDILELSPSTDIAQLKQAWFEVIFSPDNAIYTACFVPIDSSEMGFGYCLVEGLDPPQVDGDTDFWFDVTLESGSLEELDDICETTRKRASNKDGYGGLLQLTFAQTKDSDRRFLVISIAHALYDGWSLGLLHQDVQAAYNGTPRPYRRDPDGNLPPSIYAILNNGQRQDCEAFWSDFLGGATPTILPATGSPSKLDSNPINRKELISSQAIVDIGVFCKTTGITAQVLGQACWAALLSYHTGGLLDVTFGIVVSGRDDAQLENLSYPTMNTVAVRSILHGNIYSWLRYMQDNMGSIRRFQHYELRKAQRLAGPGGALFNTLFMQQQQPASSHPQLDDKALWKSTGGSAAVGYPVCVEMELLDSGLVWRSACDTNYVSTELANELVHHLDSVLGHIIRSSADDVLVFSAQAVTICGLPSIQLKVVDSSSTETLANSTPVATPNREWTPTELIIREALAEVSGVAAESILHGVSIYSLGLDSISAVKASSALRKKGIKISFRDMLQATCISEMARLIQQDIAKAKHPLDTVSPLDGLDIPAILKEYGITSADTVLPATAMQVHMLSAWHNTKGAIFYPEFGFRLTGGSAAVTLASITHAWYLLVAETPILRTIFVPTKAGSSVPVLQVVVNNTALEKNIPQVPVPQGRYKRLFMKLRKFASNKKDASTDQWFACTPKQPLTQPFNSLKVKYDGKKDCPWSLRLRIHHALYDAISLPSILSRFTELVQGSNQQAQATIGPVWENVIASEVSASSKKSKEDFWKTYLSGLQPSSGMSTKAERESSTGQTSVFKPSAIPDISSLLNLCKSHSVSIQSVFFAAYARFLSVKKGDGADVLFGIYLANRADEYEGLTTYPTLRLVPLRVHLQSNFWGMVKKIQEDIHLVQTGRNTSVSLWEIKEWTGGLVVDSFVNFLAVGTEIIADDANQLRLVKDLDFGVSDREGIHFVEEYLNHSGGDFALSGEIRAAYPPAVDIEVALEDGGMSIGVFGMQDKVDEDGARKIIDGVVGILEGSKENV